MEMTQRRKGCIRVGRRSIRPLPSAGVLLAVAPLALFAPGCSGDDDFGDPNPQAENKASGPGDFYSDFLAPSPYPKLLIEIDVMEGAMPDTAAVTTLVDMIKLVCDKPGGVDLLFPDDTIPADPAAGENPEYSLADVNALEDQYRNHYRGDGTAVMYFVYLDGHSDYDEGESKVVGYAYHGSSMAIFMGTVGEFDLAIVRSGLTKTVTVHEFGHIIGLVDNGADMVTDHLDPEDHGAHCDNPDCMMYYLNNTSDLVSYVLTGEVPDFDDNCLTDLYSAGGLDARTADQPD